MKIINQHSRLTQRRNTILLHISRWTFPDGSWNKGTDYIAQLLICRQISFVLISIACTATWNCWPSTQKKKKQCFSTWSTTKVKRFILCGWKFFAKKFLTYPSDFEFKTSKEFWTSGTDLGDEGKFFFITNGRTVDHLSWSNEEPNNGKKSDTNETENCMSYTRTDNLKFYRLFDRFCSLESHFVCQEVQQRKPFRQ